MQAKQSILDRIQRWQLKWYGPILRMANHLWSTTIFHSKEVSIPFQLSYLNSV